MARKALTEETQTSIFLKSRRRCCLCFWLKGEDEVKKGQIAHLDGDNENPAEGNLVFLCLEHHDEFDSTTRISKGLRASEVKRWRDELYKEMQYRFRSIKTRECTLVVAGFKWQGPEDEFCASLVVKNTGEVGLSHVTVSIRLVEGVFGEIPPQPVQSRIGEMMVTSPAVPEPWAAYETRQDLFETNGRVCIQELPGSNSVLMPGHSHRFDALLFRLRTTKPGESLELDYRIDAAEMPTVSGKLTLTIPTNPDALLFEPPET